MQTSTGPIDSKVGAPDILFECEHCGVALIVDPTAAGMTLKCKRCEKRITVPPLTAPVSATRLPVSLSNEKLAELRRHLKENESQRTEINGYINQLSIQLHRWRLRLQTLDERNKQLAGEVAQLDGTNNPRIST
jgi:transcription elongation factor Elf1